jgi:chromosome segregation protein
VFLKSLTLKGFKSFAETTTLDFEPGVTVVVGPNGSGKSNIVDAVAWVLGAQGPRTVRSSKMEDVIFAGSAKRPALGRAEVSLTIDNSSGILPIEFTEVTVTRTLFRSSGESEYAINGVPCRLLDVQELLSDSGVGRQQHVIVSQGQLDSVLNARPEDRRMIIEEAAGVLKYRRRKEKAERRLSSTEGNLLRLQDLLREVRRQLRPLERQADAARRHGDLVAELAALRLHLAGREISSLRARAEHGAQTRLSLDAEEANLKATLIHLDTGVMSAEASLSASDAAGLTDAVGRLEALRERARGLAALLGERSRSVERDRAASVDRSLIAALEAESSALTGELQAIELTRAASAPQSEELADAERALAAERADVESQWADGVDTGASAAAEMRGELSAIRTAVDRGRTESTRLESRLKSLHDRAERLDADAARLRAELEDATSAEGPLLSAVDESERGRSAIEAEVVSIEAARRRAEADCDAWTARAEALALALDETRARAGAARLADLAGVVGTLLDLVEVDPGWEAAFEAAAGDALAAVVVADANAARSAVARLKETSHAGSVIALGLRRGTAGLPLLGEPVRQHVRSTHLGVEELLDVMLASAVVVPGGWQEALDVALAYPGAVAVTPAGDRFSADASRVGASRVGATQAALEEARTRSRDAAGALETAEGRLAAAKVELEGANQRGAEAAGALDANDGRLGALGAELQQVDSERRDASIEASTVTAHQAELAERLERESTRVAELEESLSALGVDEADGAARVEGIRSARRRLEERSDAVAAMRRDLEVQAAQQEARRGELARRLTEVDERLARHASERAEAEQRRLRLDDLALHTSRLAGFVQDRLAIVEGELARFRERRRQQSEAARAASERLEALRRQRVDATRGLEEVRERSRRAELEEAEARMRLEAAVETLRREQDCEPEAAMGAECPELPPGTSPPNRVRELERELRLMGPINPLALEEYEQLSERHTFLEGQLEDIKASRRELAKVIKAVDREIVDVFAAAFADVAENFTDLFETLFPGGSGRLSLTEPDSLLDTGIEVEARPVGKNVRKLSLLSGGERSLTALAFLFAVFRSRPSPFYLMDEVEAALDDVNLHRFLDLVHEFREEAQLLVVTHQKRTMEASDVLYGVTMQPGGSSRVISERVTVGA